MLYVKSGDLQRNVAGIIIVYQGKIVTLKVIIDLERGLKKKKEKAQHRDMNKQGFRCISVKKNF